MKNHTIVLTEIATKHTVQLAAQVDAHRGKKALIAEFVPGQEIRYVVKDNSIEICDTSDIHEAIAAYNVTEI